MLGAGRFQMPFATQAVMMGGNVRVGLEDSLSAAASSRRATPSRSRRSAVDRGARLRGRDPARRAILGLKGGPDEVLVLACRDELSAVVARAGDQ